MRHGPYRGSCTCSDRSSHADSISNRECEDCRRADVTVQHFPPGTTALSDAPPIVRNVLGSPGRPLDPEVQAAMEAPLGHDFGRVRVHTDARAAESARAVGAFAFTAGTDIVFGSGRYAPGTVTGARLLAHELAHTVQQSILTGPVASSAATRLESYRGVAILATNLKGALDPAFLRRIRFVVSFPFPDAAGRAEIWRRVFPAATPTAGIDPERLAQLTAVGGNIRNIAVNAAFTAASAGEP
jgi:hypothetical protein